MVRLAVWFNSLLAILTPAAPSSLPLAELMAAERSHSILPDGRISKERVNKFQASYAGGDGNDLTPHRWWSEPG